MGDASSPCVAGEEWTRELDRNRVSGGAEAAEAAPLGGLARESEVIALMLEAAPFGELGMLST